MAPPASLPRFPLSFFFKSLQVLASLEIYDVFCFSNTLRSYLGDKELRGMQIAYWLEKENMMYGECRLFLGSESSPPCLGRHIGATERHWVTSSETAPPTMPHRMHREASHAYHTCLRPTGVRKHVHMQHIKPCKTRDRCRPMSLRTGWEYAPRFHHARTSLWPH